MNTAGSNDHYIGFFERGLLLGFVLMLLLAVTLREFGTIRSFEHRVAAGMEIASRYVD